MSEEESRKLVEAIRRKKKEIGSSREAAIQFLKETGILDKNEQPTPPYRNL